MPITKRIYRARRGTVILAVDLYAPPRNLQRTSALVRDLSQGTIAEAEKAEKAVTEQVNAVHKFDTR